MNSNYGKLLLCISICTTLLYSCYKKDIQFGTNLGETYTNLVQIDTVGVEMSTVLLDSFVTTSPSSFLFGRYKDDQFGIINAMPFFMVGLPSDVTMETTAVYDSLEFIIKTNHYYYGDTTRSLTISVHELSQSIDYSYSDELYNTTEVAIKPNAIGKKTMKVSPVRDSLIQIKLDDIKGRELFDKLVQKSDDVLTADVFFNNLKGIRLSAGDHDEAVIYGLRAEADAMVMRLHYHTSIPYDQAKYKDFAISTDNKYFNQVLTDRSQTLLGGNNLKFVEIPASNTNNRAFSQTATGVLLKVTFPTLREILKTSDHVQLLKASLVLHVAEGSYNSFTQKLPGSMYLAQTDGSNAVGSSVVDADGSGIQYSTPEVDHIYNTNATYTFDVTSYIKSFLSTPGSSDQGFFILEDNPQEGSQVNRAVFNAARNGTTSSQLILSVVTINN